jgi:hypothetical protein
MPGLKDSARGKIFFGGQLLFADSEIHKNADAILSL